jgi:hypothetical protein
VCTWTSFRHVIHTWKVIGVYSDREFAFSSSNNRAHIIYTLYIIFARCHEQKSTRGDLASYIVRVWAKHVLKKYYYYTQGGCSSFFLSFFLRAVLMHNRIRYELIHFQCRKLTVSFMAQKTRFLRKGIYFRRWCLSKGRHWLSTPYVAIFFIKNSLSV